MLAILQLSTINCQLSTLTGCTRADLTYPVQPVGRVQIYPDISTYTLPAVQYHFYDMSGEQEPIIQDCDGYGNFDGVLPIGNYRVIATNVAASRVTFVSMDSHETAIVRLPSLPSPVTGRRMTRAEYTLLPQPGNVYSTVLDELTVSGTATVRKEPTPVLLTKQLNLIFSLEENFADEVTDMTGVLPGIYPAVHLYTHQGVDIETSPDMATPFETTADGSDRKVRIYHFGLVDPQHGDHYTSILELQLTMTNGSTATISLDLTETLSDMIDQNNGTLPMNVSIPIELTKTEIGFTADIGSWIEEGEERIYN